MSIQLLADAAQWAKDNPDLHDQHWFSAFKNGQVTHCLIGRVAEWMGTDWHHVIAEHLGITWKEFDSIFLEFDKDKAIEKAEALVVKYSEVLV